MIEKLKEPYQFLQPLIDNNLFTNFRDLESLDGYINEVDGIVIYRPLPLEESYFELKAYSKNSNQTFLKKILNLLPQFKQESTEELMKQIEEAKRKGLI